MIGESNGSKGSQGDQNESASSNHDKEQKDDSPPSKIQPQSIQAAAFVPSWVRGTLNVAPGATLSAEITVPNLVQPCIGLRQRLCPSFPIVPVPTGLHGASVQLPARFMPYHDLHYALWYRNQELQSTQPNREVPSVNKAVDLDSFCRTFDALVMEERLEVLLRYERYTQYNAKVTVGSFLDETGRRRCSFGIDGITGARPAIQVGDFVLLRTTNVASMKAFAGKGMAPIELHLQCFDVDRKASGPDTIQCSWISNKSEEMLEFFMVDKGSDDRHKFHIRIVPRADIPMRCVTALSWLSTLPKDFVEKLMFPTEAPNLRPLDESFPLVHTADLNTQQLSFVRSIIQRTHQPELDSVRSPLILTGPAGTGKTKTLLCALRQVLMTGRSRVLVCAPSHTAADVITRRLADFYDNKKIFRLYNADRQIATVPVQVLPLCRQETGTGYFTLPPVEELLSFDIIVCTCHDAHILYQTGLTNQQLRMHRMQVESRTKKELNDCGIIMGDIPAVHEPHFTHLFIDEAAQATEPESLIPLSVVVDPIVGSRKVEIALVGDPRQLSPQVYSSRAARAGFNRSWMERLLRRPVQCLGGGDNAMLGPDMKNIDELLRYSFARDGHEQLSFFLTTNYRGHPSFLIMPSALFYADKLHWASYDRANRNEDLASEWCGRLRHVEALSKPVIPRETTAQKRFDFPIHFRGVVGNDTSQTIKSGSISEESWTNEAEAKTVAEIVKTLTEEAGVGSQSIGVMAPFRGQVALIRSLLRKKGLANINVGTIEDYQGIEKEVVVLSLTRSTDAFVPFDVDRRIGVFRQEKQSNVALTRAEQMQIAVGNPNIMAGDPVWKQWLWFCLRNGLWYGDEGSTRTAFEKIDQLPTFPTLRPGSMEQKPSDDLDDYVVVSALEGILRNT